MRKPTVLTKCIANMHTDANERIIEYSDRETGLGGLISLRRLEDGSLRVHLYRHDERVDVKVSKADG